MNRNRWTAKKIDGIRLVDGDVMACPVCACEKLHHQSVEVFSRAHLESLDGICVQVLPGASVHANRSIEGNPSSRRDGIRIYFHCEWCHHDLQDCPPPYEMLIYQHKGCTYIETMCYVENRS